MRQHYKIVQKLSPRMPGDKPMWCVRCTCGWKCERLTVSTWSAKREWRTHQANAPSVVPYPQPLPQAHHYDCTCEACVSERYARRLIAEQRMQRERREFEALKRHREEFEAQERERVRQRVEEIINKFTGI